MEDKRSSTRTKRQKAPDEGYWDCSVCTFRNSPEAYKCEMCDVRKGTSTRKPRLNPQLVAAQVAQQFAPPATKKERSSTAHTSHNGTRHNGEDSDSRESSRSSNRRHSRWPRLKNVDRSSATQMAVTVGNLTVIITDYKPKKASSSSASSASSENQIHSDTSDTNSSYTGNDHDPNEDSPAEGAGN